MSLRNCIDEIDRVYAGSMVAQGSRGRAFKTRRFQMMVFDADVAMGGGVPWGKFIQIYGPASGGKTVQMLKMMAGAQQYCRYCRELFLIDADGEEFCACEPTCPDCNTRYEFTDYEGPAPNEGDPYDWAVLHDEWICKCLVNPKGTKAKKDRIPKVTRRATHVRGALFDAEHSFDDAWARVLGVNTDLLFVFIPEYAEQGIDIADKLLRSGEIDFLGIDSIADLTPSKEIEESVENWQMALQARLVNKGLRKLNSAINALGANASMLPVVLMINQIRDNINGYEEVCPGGKAQIFRSAIRIRVNPAKYQFKEYGTGKDKVQELQYADMSGFTKKNKTYKPMQRFSFRLYLDDVGDSHQGSTNEAGVIVKRAIELEVIARDKSTYSFTLGNDKHVWKSQKAIVEHISDDHRLFWGLREETMAEALKVA